MKNVRVVFLDRDGVINEYPGRYKYVTSIADFRLLPGAADALMRLANAGFRLFVISNQAGVAKGLYTKQMLDDITSYMLEQLGTRIKFDNIYYCTHLPEEQCACRKPQTAFIDAAAAQLKEQGCQIDRPGSFFVGDSIRDVETGKKAGLGTILVFSGCESPQNRPHWQTLPDHTAADLPGAADHILSE